MTEPHPARTRGFITIATGKERYFWLAWHLLQSYRYHAKDPLPFAILCDRENRYTKDFDRVILLDRPAGSFNDKLRLPDYVPFDETVFLDADTLVYNDPVWYFDAFRDAGCFSAFGATYPLDVTDTLCWFLPEGAGRYRDRLHFLNLFQGGAYYLRRTEQLPAVSALCREICDTFGEYDFYLFRRPADEPIYALAMSVLGLPTVPDEQEWNCYSQHVRYLQCDIRTGQLDFVASWLPADTPVKHGGSRIHWGTKHCSERLYQREAFRLRCAVRKGHLMTASFLARSLPLLCYKRARRAVRRLFGRS